MAQKVNLQERLKMRFLTVDYKEKQEAYGTSTGAADTGSIALEILNLPDAVLEELLELTEPMMQLMDFLNNNRNPDSSTLAMMLTASRNVFRVVDLKLEKVTRRKKKIAAATYRYQADCDGEWGEIQFDFSKRKAKVLYLADWDTSRTKLYAKRVIDHILRTGGNDLPKKERIVFER